MRIGRLSTEGLGGWALEVAEVTHLRIAKLRTNVFEDMHLRIGSLCASGLEGCALKV